MLDSCKMLQKQSEAFHTFLWYYLKQNFIAYRSSKVSDCIFEIHQLWQSGFSRVYSNSCCSCSFKPELVNIGQSSHKMYSNIILNFQESATIVNTCIKKSLETYWRPPPVYLMKPMQNKIWLRTRELINILYKKIYFTFLLTGPSGEFELKFVSKETNFSSKF